MSNPQRGEQAIPESELYRRVKRPHKKSRYGCLTCKRRRVKVGRRLRRNIDPTSSLLTFSPLQCDERLPHCSACTVRGLECIYADSQASSPGYEIVTLAQHSWLAPDGRSFSPSLRPTYRQVPDGLLFQYYLRHVSGTLATTHTDTWLAELWQSAVPAVAFTNPGTSHAIMALSALYMSSSNMNAGTSSLDYLATAELHYSMALANLRTSIENLKHISIDAILACCITLVPCSLAMARGPTVKNLFGDWIFHMRGFATLGDTLTSSSRPDESRHQLIRYPQPNNPGLDLPATGSTNQPSLRDSRSLLRNIQQDRHEVIEKLRLLVAGLESEPSSLDTQVHLEAIERLDFLFSFITECDVSNYTRAVFHWVVQIPARFVRLLADMDGVALIVFAHWLVPILAVEEVWWWLRGCGSPGFGSSRIQTIADVLDQVQSPYRHLLVWPMKMAEQWGMLSWKTIAHNE